jgi:hypothetical protein
MAAKLPPSAGQRNALTVLCTYVFRPQLIDYSEIIEIELIDLSTQFLSPLGAEVFIEMRFNDCRDRRHLRGSRGVHHLHAIHVCLLL